MKSKSKKMFMYNHNRARVHAMFTEKSYSEKLFRRGAIQRRSYSEGELFKGGAIQKKSFSEMELFSVNRG